MHGVLPAAIKMGTVALTIFLKTGTGLATTSPFRWNLPPLLKGKAVVPSNWANRTKGCQTGLGQWLSIPAPSFSLPQLSLL
jgi:hypothetical protein